MAAIKSVRKQSELSCYVVILDSLQATHCKTVCTVQVRQFFASFSTSSMVHLSLKLFTQTALDSACFILWVLSFVGTTLPSALSNFLVWFVLQTSMNVWPTMEAAVKSVPIIPAASRAHVLLDTLWAAQLSMVSMVFVRLILLFSHFTTLYIVYSSLSVFTTTFSFKQILDWTLFTHNSSWK